MSLSRCTDDDIPANIKSHFYGRLFTPCLTPEYGKYAGDNFAYRWEGMVEDTADKNRTKMFALVALSIASFGVTLNSVLNSNPVSAILSAATGAGLALLTAVEADRVLHELHPYLMVGGPKYW